MEPSGVTTTPATPAIQGAGKLPNLLFLTKNRPIKQQNVPYLGQLSDRSTRKKYLGLQKAPVGGKKALRGRQKIVSTFFSFFRH